MYLSNELLNHYSIPESFKSEVAGNEAGSLPLGFIIMVQFPFLGVWFSIFRGTFELHYILFLLAYFIILIPLLRIFMQLRTLEFGYTEKGLYRSTSKKTVFIPWEELRRIELIREYQEFNETDLFAASDLSMKRHFLYRIIGTNSRFSVSQFYSESNKFAEMVTKISGRPIHREKWTIGKWLLDNQI